MGAGAAPPAEEAPPPPLVVEEVPPPPLVMLLVDAPSEGEGCSPEPHAVMPGKSRTSADPSEDTAIRCRGLVNAEKHYAR